jgi:hypothetical protein
MASISSKSGNVAITTIHDATVTSANALRHQLVGDGRQRQQGDHVQCGRVCFRAWQVRNVIEDLGGWFYHFIAILPTARKSRNVGLSQDGGDFVGALDYGGDNDDDRECSRSGTFRGGTTWAYGVFGKMPRRRQGMHQSMYLAISNQGARVVR